MRTEEKNQREFGRFAVQLQARFRVIEAADEIEALAEKVRAATEIWSPEGESELRKLADGPLSGSEGALARAILSLGRQVERLTHRLMDDGGPMEVGNIVELSGGGALFVTGAVLDPGSVLDFRVVDDEGDAPPMRVLARVVHISGPPPRQYGLRFEEIHPVDRERLIRYVYQIQRRELRKA